jgi:hypothetical protein
MKNDYKNVTLKRKDLEKVLKAFQGENVNFGIEFNSVQGEKILYVTNNEFGKNRQVIQINE